MFNPKEFNPHQQDCIEVLIEKTRRGQIDRRTFLKGMGLMAALPLIPQQNWFPDFGR